MKVRASVQRLCRFCRVTKRRGILFVLCTKKAKHKQRQGFATLAFPPTIPSPAAAAAAAAAPPLASKVAKEEIRTKFNWPVGLAALLKNGDK